MMNEAQMRKQVGAAIQRGDLDEALRLLMPPPTRRKSLFALDAADDVVEIDEAMVTDLCEQAMRKLVRDLRHDIVEHVGSVVNRLRGRAD